MDDVYFQVRYSSHPGRTKVWKAICEYLISDIEPQDTVLELGAGYCDFINQIPAETKYAMDANPDVQRHCAEDVQFVLSKDNHFDVPAQSVDVVFASNFFEHLNDADRDSVFDQLSQCLKPKCTLILMQPNYHYAHKKYWDDYTHVKAYSHVSLPDMVAAKGYTIRRVEKRFLPFSFKSVLPASYWLTKAYLASFWRPYAGQMLVVAEKTLNV